MKSAWFDGDWSVDKSAVAWGVQLNFLSAELVEFCGAMGFEWLFLDAQHTPVDVNLCRDLVRAADLSSMFCMMRVASTSSADIDGFLDVGVRGIIAPNISTAEQARALVAAVKFAPRGTRGAAFRSRAARYGLTSTVAEYAQNANDATLCAAIIETRSGVDNIESILAVEGLDYVSVGANDLGQSLGVPPGTDDARLPDMLTQLGDRLLASGKPQIAVVQTAEQGAAAIARGARLIAVSDTTLMAQGGRSFLRGTAPR